MTDTWYNTVQEKFTTQTMHQISQTTLLHHNWPSIDVFLRKYNTSILQATYLSHHTTILDRHIQKDQMYDTMGTPTFHASHHWKFILQPLFLIALHTLLVISGRFFKLLHSITSKYCSAFMVIFISDQSAFKIFISLKRKPLRAFHSALWGEG